MLRYIMLNVEHLAIKKMAKRLLLKTLKKSSQMSLSSEEKQYECSVNTGKNYSSIKMVQAKQRV